MHRLLLLLPLMTLLSSAAVRPNGELWLDLIDGEETSEAAVLADLATAGVVYVGEAHTIARHHAMQLHLFEELAARGGALVLCLEQLEVRDQPAVDRFNRGEIDFDALATEINWAKKWKNYTDYRPLLEAARAHHMPVQALNAPPEVIRAISRGGGLVKLPADQRTALPAEIVTDDPVYEHMMNLQLAVHMAMDPAKLRPVFEAQVARDETMAANIAAARRLATTSDKPRTAFVIVGAGHVRHGLGTAARVRRRDPGIVERIVLLTESGQLELTAADKAATREISISHAQLREIGRPPGDYLHVLPLAEAAKP
jgi:uncharacterized iron-regulated protein